MESETTSLNDLPEEVLLKIFSHFGLEDLCLILAKVCERWKGLTKSMIMCKKLSYSCDDDSDISHIKEVLTAAPALHSLIICERDDVADILEFLNHIHSDLRKLIFEHCRLGEDNTGLLANIVALYPDLEVLSLADCYPLTSVCFCLIPCLKNLSELNLSFYDDCELSGNTFRLIADSCQHLKKLILDRATEILDDDVIHVIDRLGKQLTTLVLDGNHLTDIAYSYLKNCSRLQELEFTSCYQMTDTGLMEGIGSLQELTSLHLTEGHNLGAEALSTFLHRTSMTSIVLLNLSGCSNLDDEGLKGIAESVTDAGVSMVISHCSQLRVLNLSYLPHITGKGWLELVPSYLPHLGELCLQGCDNECHKFVEELKAAAPELKVSI